MANTLLTIDMISREVLMVLKNNTKFARYANRTYEKYFAVDGLKSGDTINIRKPPRYTVGDGNVAHLNNTTETSVPLTVTQKNVALQFTTAEQTLSIDEYRRRFIIPAVAPIVNIIDKLGLETLALATYNSVGTPGVTPTSLQTYQTARAKILDMGAPVDGLMSAFIGTREEVALVNDLRGLFQSSAQIKSQYEKGQMGTAVGLEWTMDQNIHVHTVGALGGTPLVNLAGQTGSTINTDGWTASITGVLKRGDVITFAGVYSVNPQSYVSTNDLAQFVVTADVDSSGAGEAAVPISPAIVTSGTTQNVTGAPANNAVILIFGHASSAAGDVTKDNLVFHRDAICCAFVDLQMPRSKKGVDGMRVVDEDSGMSIRVLDGFDIYNDRDITRLDVLFGWVASYPELSCRVQG